LAQTFSAFLSGATGNARGIYLNMGSTNGSNVTASTSNSLYGGTWRNMQLAPMGASYAGLLQRQG
jgi:hypothetical protein